MISQTKHLKQALKKAGIKDSNGKTPSCRVERKVITCNGSRYTEWGDAVAIAIELTDSQIETLKELCASIQIYNNKECGFSVLRW